MKFKINSEVRLLATLIAFVLFAELLIHSCGTVQQSLSSINDDDDDYRQLVQTAVLPSRANCSAPSSIVKTVVVGGRRRSGAATVEDRKIRFNHLQFDKPAGMLYVAGVNRLLQLDAVSLKVISCVLTGPKLDSAQCHATGCSSSSSSNKDLQPSEMNVTDNVNKILLIESNTDSLIVCGSVYQGSCERYSLTNISAAGTPRPMPVAVAANDDHSSTFAFIGSERYDNNWDGSNVLYVGTTYNSEGFYRDDIPAIATRNLYTMEMEEYSFSRQSNVRIDVKYRDNFLVNYVYGFNYSHHAYFVMVQRKSYLPGEEEDGYISRIARVCSSDNNYDTYVEITLQCSYEHHRHDDGAGGGGGGGKSKTATRKTVKSYGYNLIQDVKLAGLGENLANYFGVKTGHMALFATYSSSEGFSNQPKSESVLCVHTMQEIETKFDDNIHMCFNGSMKYRNMPYISGLIMEGACPEPEKAGVLDNLCNVGLRLSGTVPISAKSAVHFPDELVTSVAVTTVQSSTVCFLGTSNGSLKKVLLSTPTEGTVYDSMMIDRGNKILPEMEVSLSNDYIYFITASTITKVKTQNCGKFNNCTACLNANDPFCGWCALERRCTIMSECDKATRDSPRWLPFDTDRQCIDFDQVSPDGISIDQFGDIQLKIRHLPELPQGAKYECIFGPNEPTKAIISPFGLVCPTPEEENRPKIPDDQDHVSVLLSIRSSETNTNFVTKKFFYFNCSAHRTCLDCTTSGWTCDWCLYENRCMDDRGYCKGTTIHGVNNPYHTSLFGKHACPKVVQPAGRILIPNAIPKEIVVKLENIPRDLADYSEFVCVVTIEGADINVPAWIDDNNTVTCQKTSYTYKASRSEYQIPMAIVWNHTHRVDRLNVTLYKCSSLGSHRDQPDCSLCISHQPGYLCSWCNNKCEYEDLCPKPSTTDCPLPRIDMIYPLSGPLEGGTLVTIEGSNFGIKEDQVMYRIRIGDIACELVEYHVSTKVVCRTGPSHTEQKAKVVVGNRSGYTVSAVLFNYEDVVLTAITPAVGPISGGTQLAIIGDHLNIGDVITAWLDESRCLVNFTQATSSRITCTTSQVFSVRNISRFTLTIDNAKRTLDNNPFSYSTDPTVDDINPLRTFISGGRTISVHGTNLDVIQKPEMIVYDSDFRSPLNKTICTVLNPIQMTCPSPAVNSYNKSVVQQPPGGTLSRSDLAILQIGFIMDDVKSVANLQEHRPEMPSLMTYTKDPKYYRFPDEIKYYEKSGTIILEGEYLNTASDDLDVIVTIGTERCNITGFTNIQLECSPPLNEPSPTDDMNITTHTEFPAVIVHVGSNLKFRLGYIRYSKPEDSRLAMMKTLKYALVAVILLLVVVILVLMFFRYKAYKADRNYERVLIDSDVMNAKRQSALRTILEHDQKPVVAIARWTNNDGLLGTEDANEPIVNVIHPNLKKKFLLEYNLQLNRSNSARSRIVVDNDKAYGTLNSQQNVAL